MKKHPHFYIPRAKAFVATTLAALGAVSLVSCADHAPLPPAVTTTAVATEATTAWKGSEVFETTAEMTAAETTASETEATTEETVPPAPVLRTEREEERESIPFETVYEYSSRYYEGTKVTKREGKEGEMLRVTITTFEDDIALDATVTETLITEPVASIVVIGTKDVTTYSTETVRERTLSYETETRYDDTRYDDERVILQGGRKGYVEATYRITYYKGSEVGRTLLSRNTVDPQTEIVSIGTIPAWETETVTEREAIVSFETEYIYDDTRPDGERTVVTAGQDGYTTTAYELRYYRGELSSKTVKESTVTDPVTEVIRIGTKKEEAFVLPFKTGQGYYLSQGYHSGHKALDFAIWYGDPIYAVKSGTVIFAYDEGYFSKDDLNWTYGTFVMIEHEDGVRSLYAHLKSRTVSIGDKVKGGQMIGTSGNTGRVNPMPDASNPLAGTHLHFEIRKKQGGSYVKVDPTAYLPDF